VEEIAKKRGISMAQVAVAWSMQKDGVTAPIVGTTSVKNLEDLIGESRARGLLRFAAETVWRMQRRSTSS
jgi:aryl-alcohol dehydrogenase-like predicted oxidoreductase